MTTGDDTVRVEQGQVATWNGRYGQAWVEARELLDDLFRPFEELLADAAGAHAGGRALDVGCGAGATTVAVARRLGAPGSCVGVDISEPMLAAARARAERARVAASFVLADAQTHRFERASFDLVVSRFGVMFFADPVAAFANLREAATEGAELRFVTWRGPAENPFMTVGEQAAAPLLPDPPPRSPDAPGPFRFAVADRVAEILAAGGWAAVDIQPLDVVCTMPEAQLIPYLTRIGPVARALEDADEPTRARVIEAVRPAFDRFVHGDEVRFTATCWTVRARASGE